MSQDTVDRAKFSEVCKKTYQEQVCVVVVCYVRGACGARSSAFECVCACGGALLVAHLTNDDFVDFILCFVLATPTMTDRRAARDTVARHTGHLVHEWLLGR